MMMDPPEDEIIIKHEVPWIQAEAEPPLLISSRSPPPLIQSKSYSSVNVGPGPPKLIPTGSRVNGTQDQELRSNSRPVPDLPTHKAQTCPNPLQSTSAPRVSASTSPPTTCCIGNVYRVTCHRKYLRADYGFAEWSELDSTLQQTILHKIQNQYKPKPTDLLCFHHLKELSYVEEPDPNSPDKDKGLCIGYGIVHKLKLPVRTTRLGVLTYFNNIAGKNRDALPGKFVCSTCIKILRGTAAAFMSSKLRPTTTAAVKRKDQSTTSITTTAPTKQRKVQVTNSNCTTDKEQNSVIQVDASEDEEEIELFNLRESKIIISEFEAGNDNHNEHDPLGWI